MPDTPLFSCNKTEISVCGPTFIETCDYQPELCTAECRFGCFCKKGYVHQTNESGSSCFKREAFVKKESMPTCFFIC